MKALGTYLLIWFYYCDKKVLDDGKFIERLFVDAA